MADKPTAYSYREKCLEETEKFLSHSNIAAIPHAAQARELARQGDLGLAECFILDCRHQANAYAALAEFFSNKAEEKQVFVQSVEQKLRWAKEDLANMDSQAAGRKAQGLYQLPAAEVRRRKRHVIEHFLKSSGLLEHEEEASRAAAAWRNDGEGAHT
jgi:hypothetical protein